MPKFYASGIAYDRIKLCNAYEEPFECIVDAATEKEAKEKVKNSYPDFSDVRIEQCYETDGLAQI